MGGTKMAEDKKSIVKLIKGFFSKKDRNKEKTKQKEVEIAEDTTKPEKQDDVDSDFIINYIYEERRTERTDSQSSQDSGYPDDDNSADTAAEAADTAAEAADTVAEAIKNLTIGGEKRITPEDITDALKKLNLDKRKQDDARAKDQQPDDVTAKNLSIEDKDGKKKGKIATVERGPDKQRRSNHLAKPYDSTESKFSKVNTNTFSGGRVIVKDQSSPFDQPIEAEEFDAVLKEHGVNLNALELDLDQHLDQYDLTIDVLRNQDDVAISDINIDIDLHNPEHFAELEIFVFNQAGTSDLYVESQAETTQYEAPINNQYYVENQVQTTQYEAPINEPQYNQFDSSDFYQQNDFDQQFEQHFDLGSQELEFEFQPQQENQQQFSEQFEHANSELVNDPFIADCSLYSSAYPTPSPSNVTASPISVTSPQSNMSYSSPNSDSERFQDIPPPPDAVSSPESEAKKKCIMTKKQYKDMMKEIAAMFTRLDCCQLKRQNCLDLLKVHQLKYKEEERQSLCRIVAKMPIHLAYGVLIKLLWSLRDADASDPSKADKLVYIFTLVSQRALAEQRHTFLGDQGAGLLKAAALLLPHRPLLTRWLVQCSRGSLKQSAARDQAEPTHKFVFNEIDQNGNTLLQACALAGDKCADVLYELLASEPGQPPLFDVHNVNTDGYTALHIACRRHSATKPYLHVVHVLLEHGKANLYQPDAIGGDTCVHLAVNSSTCDLRLVLLLFKQIHLQEWKNLARHKNRSTMSPLDLARTAVKSRTRTNYPAEVLEFLLKCR